MITPDFYEQFEKENERFERRVAKKKKLTKKVEGFGEVTGTWRNQEGQEMARILFYLDKGRTPEYEELKDYFHSKTKGHSIAISEIYTRRITDQFGSEYVQKNPETLLNFVQREEKKRELEKIAEGWNGMIFSGEPLKNGQIRVYSETLEVNQKINPNETQIKITDKSGKEIEVGRTYLVRHEGICDIVLYAPRIKPDVPEHLKKRIIQGWRRAIKRRFNDKQQGMLPSLSA